MITTGFDARVKVQQVIDSQLPEFILNESPKVVDFLKQYYTSQEFRGGAIDIVENLDQYLSLNNLTPEILTDHTSLTSDVTSTDTTINVTTTGGFPKDYGLFRLNDEIITYTGITTNSFTGCIRGFSGITSYRDRLNSEELVFESSAADSHTTGTQVKNLSSLFLKEFYRKLKYLLAPGFEDVSFESSLDVNNLIKQIRNLYQSKGTEESFRILFAILYNEVPKVINLEDFLLKPSYAEFIRRRVLVGEQLSGDPNKLVGQMISNYRDTATGPVSEVEIITRNKKTFYKIQLFSGYNEKSLIEGTFNITPNSLIADSVSIGSSVVTVDSTIGFGQTGIINVNDQKIEYRDKSINQFFGCSGITSAITPGTLAYSQTDTIYGYEDGDTSKRVDLRITGVMSDIEDKDQYTLLFNDDLISVKNLGDSIVNNDENYKQFAFNTWIYNTRTRYEIESFSNNTVTLFETADKSSLKKNDSVDILDRNAENIVVSNAVVTSVNGKEVQINQSINVASNRDLSIRKRFDYTTSSGIQLESDKILSNVQNTYSEKPSGMYVASNSLPDYDITKEISEATITITPTTNLNNIYQGFFPTLGTYSTLSFANDVPFMTGDEVIYTGDGDKIVGLEFGRVYYVEVIRDTNPVRTNRIKLYNARSFIGTSQHVGLQDTAFNTTTNHTFTLKQHHNKNLKAKKSLVNFPLVPDIKSGKNTPTEPGPVGLMINGVEIQNYKSDDRVYYGPLDNIKVLNGGADYDVLNPPQLSISDPVISTGTTARAQTVVTGIVKEVVVDPQDFSINRVLSTTIEGGNGKDAVLEAVVSKQFREMPFNASRVGVAATGGIDIVNDALTFENFHNLVDGQRIVYSSSGNLPLGIGSFGGSNTNQNDNLVNGGIYYPQIINTKSIYLYKNLADYSAGINTVGFTTVNTGGIHKFRTFDEQNVVSEIKVLNPGSGFTNRKLRVHPVGISTITNIIKSDNHGFNDGDLINYTFQTSAVSGLSSSTQYRILKLNESEFQLAEAVGAARTNYNRKNYVSFGSTSGEGYQIFSYPPIQVKIDAEFAPGSGGINTIFTNPIVRGQITDVYVYEEGSDYGSNILNFHRNPKVVTKTGQGAQLKPIVKRGYIVAVEVQNRGKFYDAAPDLEINGEGVGAKLRAVVSDGKIIDVVIINKGTGYKENNTSINVKPPGRNVVLESNVRYLRVNNLKRFSDELLSNYEDSLSYGVVGYSTDRDGASFLDSVSEDEHSKVIGWANDGNPIYGPYAFSDPNDDNSPTRRLVSGYVEASSDIKNRPSLDVFESGYFIEDFKFNDSGDLDYHNGRYSKTPEFPNGVYAYFVGVSTNVVTGKLDPAFPYFVGDTYRSQVITERLDQTFDFNKSSLVRNTFPYRTAKQYSGSDFLFESNSPVDQTTIVESASKGSIESFVIINSGDDYKVGNSLTYNNAGTGGGGAAAEVSRVFGRKINEISTEYLKYENSVVERENSETLKIYTNTIHEYLDKDTIQISGISTHVEGLIGSHVIGVSSNTTRLTDYISADRGISTDIYVSSLSSVIGSGTSIGIGSETLRVLNVFGDENVLRVKRGVVGASHTFADLVSVKNDFFTIPVKSEQEIDSKKNYSVYFNPFESVGVGLQTGTDTSLGYHVGRSPKTISVPTQSIFLPNHPFKNNQEVQFTVPTGFVGIDARDTPGGLTFALANQPVYVINKGKDFIGIVTQVGLTTTTGGLFFPATNVNTNNSFEYAFTTKFDEITANAKKIKTQVSISTIHNLNNGDSIDLTVTPNQSVGFGTNPSVNVKYNTTYKKILVDSVGFGSDKINTDDNTITLNSHGYKTGQKVFYDATDLVSSGLETGGYFVFRVDDDKFNLAKTYNDTVSNPPVIVSIASTGGANQEISLLNPQIEVFKNNNIVFNVSDSSLLDYEFKFFYDKNLSNEFVSTGTTSTFSVAEGVVSGVTSSYTITYNKNLPTKLYYSFEKDGVSIKPDADVVDSSEIIYIDSKYNRSYNVFGVGSTTFNISPSELPEALSYTSTDTDTLEYTTNSKTASGPISRITTVSTGSNYSRLPVISGLGSGTAATVGSNAIIRPVTESIGKLNNFRIVNEGFEYASDKTLRPQAKISKLFTLGGTDIVKSISVLDGGRNYLSPPSLIIVNMYTREVIDSSTYSLETQFSGNTIVGVDVVAEPKGLDSVEHRLFPILNSNGVQVEKITDYSNGIVTLELSTPPIDGFANPPFAVGDEIFVEGLRKQSFTDTLGNVTSPGNGFNSEDNGYNFFRVVEFTNSNPAILKFNIGDLTTNAGTPQELQTGFTAVVKKQNFPTFKLNIEPGIFFLGEELTVNGVKTDLVTTVVEQGLVKVDGDYKVKLGDKLKGINSGVFATINSITDFEGRFSVDYSSKKNFGWKDNVGQLSNSLQVIPDNHYYQNLSYTIQSPKEFETIQEDVSRHVHPSGMLNFADTQLMSKSTVSIGLTDSFVSTVLDFVGERRVDTINNFDLVQDYDATSETSRFVIFKNRRLSDFIECRTNRVLQIDDISNRFSSAEFNKDTFVETIEYPITDFYSRFLVQISDEDKISSQFSEVVVLNDFDNTYTLNKVDIFTDKKLGTLSGDFAPSGDPTLRFDPVDPNNFNYNVKVYRESFAPSTTVGTGFTEFGFLRIDGRTKRLGPANGNGLVGFKTDVFEALSSKYDTLYTFAQVLNTDTNRMNYFEVVAHHDGQDNHISEFYYDTLPTSSFSGANIGTFGLNVSGGVISLNFENNINNNLIVKTKTIGIGTTGAGVGTHRFLVPGQIPGTERTAKFDSQLKETVGVATVFEFDSVLQFSQKSIIRIGVGETTVVQNLMVVADQQRSTIQSSPFINVNTSNGIGTYSSEMVGGNVIVKFHPDPEFASDTITHQAYSQHIYTDIDEFNIPPAYLVGTVEEDLANSFYGSINVFGKDKTDFDLNYKSIPIYEKAFNPANTNTLNRSTGVFSIDDHFFETGEELIYTPTSTLIGIAATSVGIGTTVVNGTLFTGDIVETGFSTITGIANSTGLTSGALLFGDGIAANTTITGIQTFNSYFQGDVVSAGATVITGIGNTSVIKVGSGIFSGDNTSLGTVIAIGINSITASTSIVGGDDRTYFVDNPNWSVTMSNVSTASTIREVFTTGITTDKMPSRVYAIRLSKDTFKLTGTAGGSGIGFTFTDVGTGNRHKLEMKKKLEKALITIDGVTQYPLAYTPLTFNLENNGGTTIGAAVSFISLSGISSIKPRDILKVDEEFLEIQNVGFGTTTSGPISGIGTVPLINVSRGFVGTSATSHNDGSEARIFKGAFNIVGNKIHFTEAPDGKGNNDRLNESALSLPKSTFNGRVYLRQDYAGNTVYDDISLGFNGIGRTFSVYKEGENTLGLEAGSNLVFINDIFQTPDTSNNTGNNYSFSADEVTGISSVTFTGITRSGSNDIIISEEDVNQNQIPRGGVVISVAATGGLGYAPLVNAKVKPTIGAGKSISGLLGVSTFSSSQINISTSRYIESTGILEITTATPHNLYGSGTFVYLNDLEFSCAAPHAGVTTTIFPDGTQGFQYPVTGISSAKTFEVNVGTSTIPHTYESGGTVRQYFPQLTFGSGYRGSVGVAVTDLAYAHRFVESQTDSIADDTAGVFTATAAVYNQTTGTLRLTIGSHTLTTDNVLTIAANSLTFTCTKDGNSSNHTYPRTTDQAFGATLDIIATTANTVTVNVGASPVGEQYAHTFVSAVANSIVAGNAKTPTNAKYTSHSGVLVLTVPNHGLTVNDEVQVARESLTFKCSSDNFKTNQLYPRSTDPVVGIHTTITAVTTNTITVNIGPAGGAGTGANITAIVGAGGTLAFNIVNGGSGYINPVVSVDSPSYDNLSVTGVSRLGIGTTTATGIGLSMTFDLSPSSVGIGTSYFEIDRFEITNPGYSFRKGDVFKPVGLVTAAGLSSPISEIKFTVTEVFNDSFSSWQLGEFDYIDSNASRQDGIRTRFPLFKNNQLLSFEKNNSDVTSSLIDFDAILLIYVNGVMQEPGKSYTFEGGTTFSFNEPPKKEDKVDVFFYRGTRNVDSVEVDVDESVKPGDEIRVLKNDSLSVNTISQDSRIVSSIISADTIETGIYLGDGIDETNYKPIEWNKQKRDLLVGDNAQPKTRDSLEGMVFPTAKVIKDFTSTDTEIFVDSAQLFNYEENESAITINQVSGLLVSGNPEPVACALTAVVSAAGTISSIDIVDGGSGYDPGSNVTIVVATPIGGIGTDIFKPEIKDKVGTVGIGSTVITGIDPSSIRVGHSLNRAFDGALEIIDKTFTVIGVGTDSIELNKAPANTRTLVRTFDFGLYQDQVRAIASTTVSAGGTIGSISITNPGSGYTSTATPDLLTALPVVQDELITGIEFVSGYSGIITGITTSVGTGGNPLAVRFDLEFDSTSVIDSLEVGYPIMVSNTTVGTGITSIDDGDSAVVGIGTTFADNIYYVHAFTRQNLTGIVTANILSTTDHIGIGTTTGSYCGSFSWGRLSGFKRGSTAIGIGVSGFTVNSGLTTYPTIQRRDFGLRDNGSLRKDLG